MARKAKRKPPRPVATPSARGRGLVVIAVACFVLSAAYSLNRSNEFWGIDFAQLWLGGKTAKTHGVAIYGDTGRALSDEFLAGAYATAPSNRLLSVVQHRERLSRSAAREWLAAPTGTPLIYAAAAGFPLRYETAILLFRVLSFLATLAACALLSRALAFGLPFSLFLTSAILVLYEPLSSDQRVANINQVQLLLFAVYVRLLMGDRTATNLPAGLLLGAAIAFKPNTALAAPLVVAYFLMRRETRRAIVHTMSVATGIFLCVVLTSWWFGSTSAWPAWLSVASRLASAELPRAEGNMALFAEPLLPTAVLMAITLVIMWRTHLSGERTERVLVASIGPLIFLIASSLVWVHYPVLALPAAFCLIAAHHPLAIRVVAAGALALVAVTPWNALVDSVDPNVWARVMGVGMIGLYATSMYALTSRRARPSPH